MLGNTAQNILSMLKGEIGNDMDSAVSPGGDSVLLQQIYNQQNWLQSEYDWPFLRIYQDIQLNFNQRYYPMPTDTEGNQVFQLDRPINAWCYWSSLWSPTDIGITILMILLLLICLLILIFLMLRIENAHQLASGAGARARLGPAAGTSFACASGRSSSSTISACPALPPFASC